MRAIGTEIVEGLNTITAGTEITTGTKIGIRTKVKTTTKAKTTINTKIKTNTKIRTRTTAPTTIASNSCHGEICRLRINLRDALLATESRTLRVCFLLRDRIWRFVSLETNPSARFLMCSIWNRRRFAKGVSMG